MNRHPALTTAIGFILILAMVIGLSQTSTRLWGGKPEQSPTIKSLIISRGMTVMEFGQANGLPRAALKEVFGLQSPSDLGKPVDEFGSDDQITARVTKKMALASEHASKNWIKIPVKFGLWFVFLVMVFIVSRKRKMTNRLRFSLLFSSVMIFGVVMGPDPGPMGTVKDAIYLYATTHAIFPPRMIALMIFLISVFSANKYICAWGCQAGTLQDLIFRINRTGHQDVGIGKHIRLPFVLTNTVRVLVFVVFTVIAFVWGFDCIAPIDPFKIYKPMHLGLIGGVFVGILLFFSLFIYRPWCSLFCPFGLVGWLVEKVSRVRISVDYVTCVACGKCATACPSTVMEAILHGDKKTIPDCFACYTCRDVCPTESIRFSSRKRTEPPAGHFDKKKKTHSGM